MDGEKIESLFTDNFDQASRTRHDNIDPAEDRYLKSFIFIRVKTYQRKNLNS